jgi:hypothetical protein
MNDTTGLELCVSYYKNGKLREQYWVTCDTKKRQGLYRSFHLRSGTRRKECWYNNGKLHGRFRTWEENGKYLEQGGYTNGMRDGVWKTRYTRLIYIGSLYEINPHHYVYEDDVQLVREDTYNIRKLINQETYSDELVVSSSSKHIPIVFLTKSISRAEAKIWKPITEEKEPGHYAMHCIGEKAPVLPGNSMFYIPRVGQMGMTHIEEAPCRSGYFHYGVKLADSEREFMNMNRERKRDMHIAMFEITLDIDRFSYNVISLLDELTFL